MRKITLREELRYRFDNTLAKGTAALIAWLFLASAVLVAASAALVTLGGFAPDGEDGERPGFLSVLWVTLNRTLDPGTLGGDTGSYAYLGALFAVTLGGIFLVSILIGVLTQGIEDKIEELRKGRSFVCERDHIIILGWSPQIFAIISELIIANESRKRAAIVILADRDKVEMEDEIRDRIDAPPGIRIVCRTGSPIDPAELAIVNPRDSRAIVVLAHDDENPDAEVIKVILALTNARDRRPEPYHIVAEIRDEANMEAARIVAGTEAELLPVNQLIAGITVQTCRQSGLSVVYQELLDFDGDEIYTQEQPELAGKKFGDALFAYRTSSLIGLRRKKDGRTILNPPMDTVIRKGDLVVLVAEDDSAIELAKKGEKPDIDEDAIGEAAPEERAPERALFLGWNRRGAIMIGELDRYVAPGSVVKIVAEGDDVQAALDARGVKLQNLTVTVEEGDTTSRRVLDRLELGSYDHIITLSSSDRLAPQAADARTLVTLLHLRDIAARAGRSFSIVSEMLDVRNRQLAEVTQADDFIVSDRLVSLMLSQIAENKLLGAVFADLFSPEGSEVYLKPAEGYVKLDAPVSFYTVVEAARRRGHVAIGYRLHEHAGDVDQAYGVCVNPDKAEKVTFTAGDKVIVLAES
ncbi:MAG: potassium transporter TrkA [Candidatus Sumerlaeia bacterium]|nr:potassium transporter TrkA [Polyangiaceae bacterium]NUP89034.1 potassium transporter TrkA [Candidatus Sumerlaeia bacterium]